MVSPSEVWVDKIVLTGNSITKKDLKYIAVILNGLRFDMVLIILFLLFTNKTSMEKRIKNVWMEFAGLKINASER